MHSPPEETQRERSEEAEHEKASGVREWREEMIEVRKLIEERVR